MKVIRDLLRPRVAMHDSQVDIFFVAAILKKHVIFLSVLMYMGLQPTYINTHVACNTCYTILFRRYILDTRGRLQHHVSYLQRSFPT